MKYLLNGRKIINCGKKINKCNDVIENKKYFINFCFLKIFNSVNGKLINLVF